MSTIIHETAVIGEGVTLGRGVRIGPYCVLRGEVEIGDETELVNSVTVEGFTKIGGGNVIYPYSVIGAAPQDLKYEGGRTRVVIGDGNVIRECVTINRGTEKGGGSTTLGDSNLLMACCHVAHDCRVGDGCIISNAVLLAGHVEIGDHAVLSGAVAMHHFVTVGEYAFVGGMSRVVQDVAPFLVTEGNPAEARSVNTVGLSRNGFGEEAISKLQAAFKAIFRSGRPMSETLDEISGEGASAEAARLAGFLSTRNAGKHGRGRQP